MNHDDLLHDLIQLQHYSERSAFENGIKALRAVVELHKPVEDSPYCEACVASDETYPCSTIQAIEKELA